MKFDVCPKISIVLSVYNEAEGIGYFQNLLVNEIKKLTKYCFELIWVNDGSQDNTQLLIDTWVEENVFENVINKRIIFSRNFGHESAMIAGIDNATGDAIICMDSDGQHPPKTLEKLILNFLKGEDIVLTKRLKRNDNSNLKKVFSKTFYRFINSLSTVKFQENSTDFFLISKQVSDILRKEFRDQTRFIRGFIQSVGFRKTTVDFEAPSRFFGKSNYSYLALFKLAINAIFSFSNKPLRISIGLSFFFFFFTILMCGYTLFKYYFDNTAPSGYTTIIIFLALSFSVLFISLAIISLYFEKLIKEVRTRPIYIIKEQK